MGVTGMTGPIVVYGAGTAPTDYNPQRAPSLFDQGVGLLDPRALYTYQPGQGAGSPVAGWLANSQFLTVDAVPSQLSTTNIAAAYSGASPVTLVSSSGGGITVGQSVLNLGTGIATAATLLAIDGAGGRVSYGSDAMIQLWDPTKMIGRNVRLTSTTATTNAGLTVTVNGFDIYGQPVTQTLTGPGGSATVSTTKCFKYISSVTFTGGSATSLAVGTGDVFEFPLRSDTFRDVTIYWASTLITASTGYTAADTTSPATVSTGDVRGTYSVQSASDGAKRLTIIQSPTAANMGSQVGLLGVTQV